MVTDQHQHTQRSTAKLMMDNERIQQQHNNNKQQTTATVELTHKPTVAQEQEIKQHATTTQHWCS
jgi:hypothetical protein